MRKFLAALTALAALAVVGGASADPVRYGVADDWPKFHACGDIFWQSSTDIGYQDLRLTVQWDEATPTQIPYQANIQAAIDCAKLKNTRVILAIYPLHPAAIGSNGAAQGQFASFVGLVGTAFSGVKDFIVGNEPNVNRFWQPQFSGGQDAAATDYEHTLAASYDALKTVRPDSVVWGPAVSSRGNDNADAQVNPSHSPTLFIYSMGQAYKASGRTKPIFDEFNFHPYPPIQDTDPFSKPFQWPQAGAANIDRIKQALWDAFAGTGQPVPAEQAGGRVTQSARFANQGLPIDMDEAGEQTTVVGHEAAYSGSENIQPIDEATQSARHIELSQIAACDPDVKAVLFFQVIDETILGGFQSGNLYADLAKKASYTGLKNEFASAQGNCHGTQTSWTHATGVIGAQGVFGGRGTDPGSEPIDRPSGIDTLETSATANEDATFTATLVSASASTRKPASARGGLKGVAGVAPVTGTVQAYLQAPIKFTGGIPDGTYKIQVVLKAFTNPSRTTTLTSKSFTVGTGGSSAGSAVTAAIRLALTQNLSTLDSISSQVFAMFQVHFTALALSFPSFNTLLARIQGMMGTARAEILARLNLISVSSRTTSSARTADATTKRYTLKVKKGAKLKAPKITGLKPGTYKLQFSMTAKGVKGVGTLRTKSFTIDKKGHVKFTKVKPKPVKKKK